MPYTPAYFTSLTLKDVRCFGGEHTVDLRAPDGRPAKWTIILGENGVGKTTLLQCLDRMSPTLDAGVTLPKEEPLHMLEELIRADRDTCTLKCQFVHGQPLGEITQPPADSLRELVLEVGPGDVGASGQSGPQVQMHCCGYGAARRPGVAKLSHAERGDPSATLHDDTATLVDVEEWLLQLDYAAKSNRALQGRFVSVRQVLIDLLPDIGDIRIVGFDRNPPAPAVEMRSPFGWIRPKQTSLGYQAMMAWIVDLANRMFTAFPDSPEPLHEPSVVLIDEIDLHLHPRWQRDLISFLDAHFPNVQFIATAHSPLVVQAAQDANLVVIRREGDSVVIDNDPQSIRGWRIDQILTSELFGLKSARPPQLEQLLSQRRALLSKRDLTDEDRAQLARLDAELGELPAGETAEDVEALETIRRFAAQLRDDRRTGT